MARSPVAANGTLTKLVQTRLHQATGRKLAVKAAQLGFTEAAYVRRLIQLDLGEIKSEEKP